MTFRPVEVYEILEPLLKDYRKIRYLGMGELLWSTFGSHPHRLHRRVFPDVHGRVRGSTTHGRASMRPHLASIDEERCLRGTW